MDDYQKGYKEAVDDVMDYLELWGGQEMLDFKNSLKYKLAKGIDYDYPWDDGEPM